ncbi:hypothetical protein AAII07_24205 [Microvirga sp. 0TCS3.31]
MRDPNPEIRARIKETHAELDRFERQAATILAVTLTLALASYSILLEMLL